VRIASTEALGALSIPEGRGLFVVDARIDPDGDPLRSVGRAAAAG
jgi:hypothetical protein